MKVARLIAVVAVLGLSLPALATVKKPAKKHAPAKKAHIASAKKAAPAKQKASNRTAVAAAPAKPADERLAEADAPATRDAASDDEADIAPSGNRRVITHSTGAPIADNAE